MRKSARYILLGLLIYLLFLIATLPAPWLAEEAATRLSNGLITLAGTRGTLWSGSGELYAGGPATGVRQLGTITWRINPLGLFIGRVQLSLKLDGPNARGQAHLGVGRKAIHAEDLSATLAAPLIALVYAPAAFFAPTGTIDVKAPNIDLSSAGLVTSVEAQWQGAGGRFTGTTALGDYRLELTGRGDMTAIRITTLQGRLDVTGEGQWRVTGEGDLQFTGNATPRSDAEQLEPLLKAIGPDLGGGRREIRINTRVPLVKQLGY
jgi:general secretion pathway protein N